MKAFFDTNLAISFVFLINSFHLKSNDAFELYSEYFWSKFVKMEFERRYEEKLINISEFFNDLQIFLQNPRKELYSCKDLLNFVRNNYSGKLMQDAENSIHPFWNNYVGIESKIPFFNMENSINFCLQDLILLTDKNKQYLENIMQLTPKRNNLYSNIDSMLKLEGVNTQDRTVILDGHDFACKFQDPIDFVTFDDVCYNGAKNIETLCFNSIKGKYDFKSSN